MFFNLGADSPKAVKKLMALSEPGKTKQRKPGPLSKSSQASKRTSSVSSIHSNNSSSSLQASSKANITNHHVYKPTDTSRVYPTLGPSQSQTTVGKGHERSKSDVAGIKLSAESSSVTSLTSLKKGHIPSAATSYSSSQLKHEQNKEKGALKSNPPRISRTISRDDRAGNEFNQNSIRWNYLY